MSMTTPRENGNEADANQEKKYVPNFASWSNAYWNPGQDGEGSSGQREALNKMAETATTFDEWVSVYHAASGEGWNREWVEARMVIVDKALAAKALEKIEELKGQATDERLTEVLNEHRGKLLKWAVKEGRGRKGLEMPEEKEDPDTIFLPSNSRLREAINHTDKKKVVIPMTSRSSVAERVQSTLWGQNLGGVIAILKEVFGDDWRRHNLSQEQGFSIEDKTDGEAHYAVVIYNYDEDYFSADKYK